jgi:hypothetical protein
LKIDNTRDTFLAIIALSLLLGLQAAATNQLAPPDSAVSFKSRPGSVAEEELQTVPIHPLTQEEEFLRQTSNWYRQIGLKGRVEKRFFINGVVGFLNLLKGGRIQNRSILSFIDYSRPSSEKRFFVIDLQKRKILFESLVAHGEASGLEIPNRFSNREDSRQTCLGFFSTRQTYFGIHGYSLKLRGLDRTLNDKAEQRSIVIHPADYVSREYIGKHGRPGRSWGCPALPPDKSKGIIDAIKGGSFLYAFHKNSAAIQESEHLNLDTAVEVFQTFKAESD